MHLIDLIKGLIEINLRLEFNLTKIKRINKFWIDLINAIKELIKKIKVQKAIQVKFTRAKSLWTKMKRSQNYDT